MPWLVISAKLTLIYLNIKIADLVYLWQIFSHNNLAKQLLADYLTINQLENYLPFLNATTGQ